jgi:hypothetical protein
VCKAVDNDKETGSKRERQKMMELDFEHTHRVFRKIGNSSFLLCEIYSFREYHGMPLNRDLCNNFG